MRGWLPTHLSRTQHEERRLAALEWLQQGTHSYAQIAEHFGVSVHTVNSWKTRLKRNGTLQAIVSSGPPSRPNIPRTEEEDAWLQAAPVGTELL